MRCGKISPEMKSLDVNAALSILQVEVRRRLNQAGNRIHKSSIVYVILFKCIDRDKTGLLEDDKRTASLAFRKI